MPSSEGQNPVIPVLSPRGDVRTIWRELSPAQRSRITRFAGYLVLLILLFVQPLAGLMRHAAQTDLHSHILLVPFIAVYLLHIRRALPPATADTSIPGTILMSGIGFAAWLAA